MTNWCYSLLTVCSEDLSKLKGFYEDNKTDEEELSFFKQIPDGDWGVKWDACDSYHCFDTGKNELIYNFKTPYEYPNKWLESVATKYKNLKFILLVSYEDGDDGNDSIKVVYKNGKAKFYKKDWRWSKVEF